MRTGGKASQSEDVAHDELTVNHTQATIDIQTIAQAATTSTLNLDHSPVELDTASDSVQQVQAINGDKQDDPMTQQQQQHQHQNQQRKSSLLLSVVPNKDLYATSTGELSRDSTVGTSNTKKETDGSSTMVTTPQSGKIVIESAVSSYSNTTADFFHDMSSSSSNSTSNSGNCGDSISGNDTGNGGSADVMGIGCCNTFDSILTVTNDLPLDKHSGHRSSHTPSRSKRRSSHSRKVSTPQQHDKHHHIIDPSAVLNFAMEHRIFLKAALNLISELDRTAPQLGMMDPIVLKAGSLKKASHLMNGVWKVKYVEIRRGMFSYYENAVSNVNSNNNRTDRGNSSSLNHSNNNNETQGELLRKNIPLEASTCTCRAVKLHQKALNFSPSGAIFELSTTTTNPRKGMNNNSNNSHNTNSNNTNNNNTTTTIKRLWMASSRAERQAWMHAINNAMVGGSVTRGDSFLLDHTRNGGGGRSTIRTSPYKDDIRKYVKQQSILRSAKTSSEYLLGLRELLNHPLHIPIAWIRKQSTLSPHDSNNNNNFGSSNNNNNNNSSSSNNYAFYESTVELSVDQLRRDLLRDSVSINGIIYRGDYNHGPERIFGALTRCIMNVGHTTVTSSSSNNRNASSSAFGASDLHHHHQSSSDLRESKALMYTRDILLAGNRTRSGGDSYFCVETLCSNSDLVVLVPSGKAVQPVEITVTEDDSEDSLRNRFNDKSDWIRTKSKLQRSWRRHYVVLSEGMLSYYEGATPRPHGLRGQQSLVDAVISITKKKSKVTSNLIDVNHDEYIVSISLKEGNTKDRLLLFESETKLLDWVYALECVTRAKPSTEMTRKILRRRLSSNELEPNSTVNSMTSILSSAQQATMDHALKLGLDSDLVAKRLKSIDHHAACDVRVSVSALTEYKVCTVNPQGDEEQDTWANIQSHFLQSFRISGGSAGRILRGEEVVRFTVLNCLDPMPSNQGTEGTLSPTSTMRSRINRRIFRNPSTDHDLIELAVPPSSGVSD